MMLIRRILSILVVMTTLLMVGCQTIKDLLDLSQQIAVKFKQDAAVSVENKSNLVVTFENSPLADLPPEERRQFAYSVAQFAYQHYAHSEALNTVAVVFQNQQVYGPVKITKIDPIYVWNVTELIRTAEDSTFATY